MSRKTLSKIISSVGKFFSPKLQSTGQDRGLFCSDFKKMADVTTALCQMGYVFNSDGQLRRLGKYKTVTDEPFLFEVSTEPEECQAHYEKLGGVITNYVYQTLQSKERLIRLPCPKDSTPENGTFIFVSKDYDLKDILVILIQGSGAVRAGQWSRALIINEGLDIGSQIPYIKKALGKGYGVMILNPNDNRRGKNQKIPHNGTGEEHARYVWDNYVKEAKASKILIVAHSYGGILTVTLSDQLKEEFEQRVKAIAMTDSVHGYSEFKVTDYLKKISKNWISSSAPLDTPLKTPEFDITRVSAGHPRHEMTSSKCIESVFSFFEEQLAEN
ncbi:FAM172 family protein homolog CG10038 [Battus philenor]|uniref:FAM172 family protein homolog CG10038 n=1 Tax=Battus philenor TaxID=42288 RepID=UPI0035CF0BC8